MYSIEKKKRKGKKKSFLRVSFSIRRFESKEREREERVKKFLFSCSFLDLPTPGKEARSNWDLRTVVAGFGSFEEEFSCGRSKGGGGYIFIYI